jgi:prepilin-type N-terminal cleavage/methylation domain-containing protein
MTRGLRGRIRTHEHGYSLVEMLIVMALMGIVMGGLTTIFVSGSRAQNELNRYFEAQQEARTALDKMRADVHCAWAAQATTSINGYPGVKLADGSCFAATPTISWCIVPSTHLQSRYALWRSTIYDANTCTSSDTTKALVADYLMPVGSPASSNNILTTPTISYQGLETVGVDFKVNTTANAKGSDTYELTDSLVTRNYGRCSSAGGCAVPSVP